MAQTAHFIVKHFQRHFRLPLLSLLALFTIGIGILILFKASTMSLENSLYKENTETWKPYALGCFIIQIPENRSLIRLLIGDDHTLFEIVPRFEDDEDWRRFLERSRETETIYISIASYMQHFSPPLSGDPIDIGGLKGHRIETEYDGLFSGEIQLWAPSLYYKGKLDIRVSYQGLSPKQKEFIGEVLQSIRFDTTQYLDGADQEYPPPVTWLFSPPTSDDLEPYDLAFEVVPLRDVNIRHQFPLPGRGLPCLSPGVWTQSKRIGELLR